MKDQLLFEDISRKLSALLAISLLKNPEEMNLTNGERLLRRFGLSNQEIANILGTTKRTVEVIKSRDQKNKKNKFIINEK